MSERPSKKERRELAKQAHAAAARRARARRVRSRVVQVITVLALIAAVFGYVQWQGAKDREQLNKVATLSAELGCSYQNFPSGYTGSGDNSAPHIDEGPIEYERVPPESGGHRSAPVPDVGVYLEPLPKEVTTHNLEHGHVLLHYADTVSEPVVAALQEAALDTPGWVISTPFDEFGMGQVLSMTGWENRVDCPKTKAEDAVKIGELAKAFVAAYRDNSYESLPGRDTIDEREQEES